MALSAYLRSECHVSARVSFFLILARSQSQAQALLLAVVRVQGAQGAAEAAGKSRLSSRRIFQMCVVACDAATRGR